MTKFIKVLTILTFFISYSSVAFSQKAKLFKQTESYPEDIKIYLNIFPEKKKPKQHTKYDSLIINLTTDWGNGNFSDEEKTNIFEITQKLYKKKYKKKGYKKLFKTVYLFKNGNRSNYSAWMEMLNALSKSSKGNSIVLKRYINNTNNLITKNTIYSSKRLSWKASNNNYKLSFDNKKLELYLNYSSTNLLCILLKDTTQAILKTNAKYAFMTNIWEGKGGKVTWERNGFGKNEVYAKLNHYKINLKKSEYQADSVTFKNTAVSSNELLGVLSEKITVFTLSKKQYPIFRSYDKEIIMKNVLKNANFVGGISMKGKILSGAGTDIEPARIDYKRKGKLFLKAYSKDFIFRKDEVFAYHAKAHIYIGEKDSIFHSMIELSLKDGEFTLLREDKGAGKSNFYDSFHKLEIDCKKITWGKPDTALQFFEAKGQEVHFQSADYFTKADFSRIQMRDNISPLYEILNFMRYKTAKVELDSIIDEDAYRKKYPFARRYFLLNEGKAKYLEQEKVLRRVARNITHKQIEESGITSFKIIMFAEFSRKNVTAVRHRLMQLSYEGFLEYFEEDQSVKVMPKLYHYTDSRAAKKDYDVIKLVSGSKFFFRRLSKKRKQSQCHDELKQPRHECGRRAKSSAKFTKKSRHHSIR